MYSTSAPVSGPRSSSTVPALVGPYLCSLMVSFHLRARPPLVAVAGAGPGLEDPGPALPAGGDQDGLSKPL